MLLLSALLFILKQTGVKLPSWISTTRDASVHFIDVGQGDAALILTENSAVVVDTGPASSADTLVEYIKSYTSKIDCLVISHPHEDHMGGTSKLVQSIPVEMIIMNGDASDSSFFGRALDVTAEKDIDLYKANPGDTYDVGDISLELFAPLRDYGDKNNNSIVMKAEMADISILFTGDAETEAEADIISKFGDSIDADILKTGHHGSSSSSSEAFLKAVSPDAAVISCATGNSYGHPHSETLAKLNLMGIKTYRTDEDGTVVLYYENGEIKAK